MLKLDVRDDTLCVQIDCPRLDLQVGGLFKREIMPLLATPVSKIVLDLAMVEFMDSFGLSGLIFALNASRRNQKTLLLKNVGRGVTYVLELTGLTDLFTILPVEQSVLHSRAA